MTAPERVPRLDRRAPTRGDQRREALLEALDQLLREGSLEAINVADVSRRAGVSRSAFYFYFESKAFAVAALMADIYEHASATSQALITGEGEPRWRIETSLHGLYERLEQRKHVYRAMLEARATNETVRLLWDSYRQSFVGPVAALIRSEREAGLAPAGPDPELLATLLLDLNDRGLERFLLGGEAPDPERVKALVTIWFRTIYGSDAEPAPAARPMARGRKQ